MDEPAVNLVGNAAHYAAVGEKFAVFHGFKRNCTVSPIIKLKQTAFNRCVLGRAKTAVGRNGEIFSACRMAQGDDIAAGVAADIILSGAADKFFNNCAVSVRQTGVPIAEIHAGMDAYYRGFLFGTERKHAHAVFEKYYRLLSRHFADLVKVLAAQKLIGIGTVGAFAVDISQKESCLKQSGQSIVYIAFVDFALFQSRSDRFADDFGVVGHNVRAVVFIYPCGSLGKGSVLFVGENVCAEVPAVGDRKQHSPLLF